MKSFRSKGSLLVIVLLLVSFVAPVFGVSEASAETAYAVRGISVGNDASVVAQDGKHLLISARIYYPAYGCAIYNYFYYDGHNLTQISNDNNGKCEQHSQGVIEGNYIAYTNQYQISGIPYNDVFIYNISSGETRQITNGGGQYQELSLKGHYLAWDGIAEVRNNVGNDIWLYNAELNQTRRITADGSNNNRFNSAPKLTNDNLYWYQYAPNTAYPPSAGNIFKQDLAAADADEYGWFYQVGRSTIDHPNTITVDRLAVDDNNNVAWAGVNSNDRTATADLYLYDGQTTKQIATQDYTNNHSLSIHEGLITWVSRSHDRNIGTYNIGTGQSSLISYQGGTFTTDGHKILYMRGFEQYPNYNSDFQPVIYDINSGQTTAINFIGKIPFGANFYAVASDYFAWTGIVAPSSTNSIYIAEPAVVPPAPTNLHAQTPTKQPPVLTWNTVSDATKYNIYRDGVLMGNSTTASYTDSSVTASGQYVYEVTAVNAANLESVKSQPVTVVYDITPPTGSFTGNTTVIRLFGQKITGTAGDGLSGVARVQITQGTKTLTSDAGGAITLSCNATKTTCTWTANPASLSAGFQAVTLTVTDLAGNTYQVSKNYLIL